jgi:hypothetical protein
MTPHDIALLRLAAHRIAGPGFATATDSVRWLTAVQAQDYPGAVTSIALRTESQTRQSVEAALNAHEIVATDMAQITALLTNPGGSGPQTGKDASKPWACRMSGSARSG